MDFISRYVREQKRYTKNELRALFRFSESEVESFITKLKSYGILKAVKNTPLQKDLTDLADETIEIADASAENAAYFYVFTYVGVITAGNRIIKCYPKYIAKTDEPISEMKQILKVLNRYGAKEQIINLYNGDAENSSFNLLAVILFLMQDYFEHGLYTNTESVYEVNGEGPIMWDKTISDGFAIIRDNRPYYIDLYTQKTVDDEQDFFRLLHQSVLTECSRQLQESDLLDLFDLENIDLCSEPISTFGDEDYLLYRLQSEINIQFNTQRQVLLKTLYAYIAHHRTLQDGYGISLYGTTSFNLVWENVCATVFDNKLHQRLSQLKLPTPLKDGYAPNDELIEVIKKPVWIGFGSNSSEFSKEAQETLIPDLINIYDVSEQAVFVIFDAKYYCIQLEQGKPLRGQPGVGDVTKQYLYQLAYRQFTEDHGITQIRNCFLMPTEGCSIVKKGIAKMEILESLGLQNIQIRLLPAEEMYSLYLTHKLMDITRLEL